jgi:hypothetical protein
MSQDLNERLNQILAKEIGFWIFDYPPEDEMQMRGGSLQDVIEPGLHKLKPAAASFATVDLFECVISLLEERKPPRQGNRHAAQAGRCQDVSKSLRSVLKEDKLAERISRWPSTTLPILTC